jgi:anti-sigma factor RsiW
MSFRRSRLETRLHDYVAGDLEPAARAEVDDLLRRDAGMRALLDEVRAAHDALSLLRERPEPPKGADEVLPAIRAAIAAQGFESRPRLPLETRGTRFYRRIAYAALLLCAFTVAILATRGPDETPVAAPEAGRDAEQRTGLVPMSAEEYLRLLDRVGGDPDKLAITSEDDVVPISLDSAEPR